MQSKSLWCLNYHVPIKSCEHVCVNDLFKRVVLGHKSPDHFRQRYGDPGQTVGEGCQQLLGPLEPLLSSSVVGQTQEIEC